MHFKNAQEEAEPEELAFYDAVAENVKMVYDQPFLRGLVHEIVCAIKRNLKVDWTEPHREGVKAEVRTAVKRVLRRHRIRKEHFNWILDKVMDQTTALYADWPLAA